MLVHDPDLAPYVRLVELAQVEAELIGGTMYDELPTIQEERAALMAGLAEHPPEAARPLLEAAQALVRESAVAIERDLGAVERALQAIDSGRRAVVGYGGTGARTLLNAQG